MKVIHLVAVDLALDSKVFVGYNGSFWVLEAWVSKIILGIFTRVSGQISNGC